MTVSFQYARRRGASCLSHNPFKTRYIKRDGKYLPDSPHYEDLVEYLNVHYPELVEEFHQYRRSYPGILKRLYRQMDEWLLWDDTPSGMDVWNRIYNELCVLEGRPELQR